ncbi:MAG: protease inhibitor I42 family protein [Mycobacterium sp.]
MSRRLLATALITTAPLMACAGKAETPKSGPQTTTIRIPYDELLSQKKINRTVTLAVGDYLQVSLGSNASTGYRWSEQMQISDPKVLAQSGHEALAPGQNMPGAPGSDVWMLQAVGPGTSTVTASYGRPWPGGEKDAWTFTADVTVR